MRAVIDYNPWDLETRREPLPDAQVLAELVSRAEPDGIFLDTLANAPGDLRGEIDKVSPANVFQSEGVVPLAGVSDHLMSWAQWVGPSKSGSSCGTTGLSSATCNTWCGDGTTGTVTNC